MEFKIKLWRATIILFLCTIITVGCGKAVLWIQKRDAIKFHQIKESGHIVCPNFFFLSHPKRINFTIAIYDRFYYSNTKFRFIFIALGHTKHGHQMQQIWQLKRVEKNIEISVPTARRHSMSNLSVNKRNIQTLNWICSFFSSIFFSIYVHS